MTDGGGVSVQNLWDDTDEADALRQYRTLVNTVDDGIYQLDPEGHIVAVNDAIVELIGYDREELLGAAAGQFVGDDDAARVERAIRRRLDDEEAAGGPIEVALRTADGGTIACELQLNILSEDGTLGGSVGVVRDVSERRRTERSLREHERRLERERDLNDRILEASPVGIMVLDGDGEVLRVNDRGREILGVDDTDGSLADVTTYDEGGSRLSIDEHPFAETLRDGEPIHDRILQVELPDGSRRWLAVSATAVRSDDGEFDRIVTTGEDVTHIKERERELERRTDDLAAELEEIHGRVTDGVVAVDESWRFTHVNERAEEMLGIDAEQLLGENAWETHTEVIGTEIESYYREAMATGEPVSFEVYFEPYDAWFEEHVYPSETGLSIYFRDVTERKEREQELERYETIVETVEDGIYTVDEEGRFTWVNEAYASMLGYGREELIGEHVSLVVDKAVVERVVDVEREMRAGERRTASMEADLRTKDGDTVPAEATFALLPGGDERVGVARDVSERKEYERELAALNRLNEVVRTTSVAAATATSREEIERLVCEELGELESFALAWIGHPERGRSTVTPAADAGADAGYLEDLTVTFDDSETGSGPTGRALRTGEPQFVHDVREDPTFAPWREDALECGFRATVALPITHEGATYGVLNVYATEPAAFEGPEGELLAQLADLVGHAVHAVQQRKALVSDSVTELELLVRDDDDPLLDATSGRDASLTVDRRVPAGGDRYVNFVTVRNVDREAFRAAIDEREYVTSVECLSSDGDEHRFEITMTELPVSEVLATHGGRLRELTMRDGTVRILAEIPPDADVREILEAMGDGYSEVELLAQRTGVRDRVSVQDLDRAVLDRLTEKQRSALEAAYFAGYFEWPRVSTGEEVADLLGVSAATFTQHLRNAERELFGTVLE